MLTNSPVCDLEGPEIKMNLSKDVDTAHDLQEHFWENEDNPIFILIV